VNGNLIRKYRLKVKKMSSRTSKSRKNKEPTRKPALKGKRYAVINCPYCGASIYKRHLQAHISGFHKDLPRPQAGRRSGNNLKGIDLSKLSPDFQEEIASHYVLDENGLLVLRKDWENKKFIHQSDDDHSQPT
jgi:hypothetical protein